MSTVLFVLILLNAVFTYKGLEDYTFFEKYKFSVAGIKHGEYYRLVSGGFLHAGWWHFFLNMLTLYFFYPAVIGFTGTFGFLLIYLGGLILGNVLAYYFHQNDLWYAAIGASGAVNAVVFSSILFNPDASIFIIPIPIPIPSYIYAVGYLLYTTFGMDKQTGNIGHEAHFGGAGAGILLTVLLKPQIVEIRWPLLLILSIIIIGGFIYVRKKKI